MATKQAGPSSGPSSGTNMGTNFGTNSGTNSGTRTGLNKELKHHSSTSKRRRQGVSMHEGIAPWCDCCVCEAEPYWADVAQEMGISLSDYEEDI